MHVKNFVICDSQKQYSKNLLQMFRQKKAAGYQYHLFHTREELERFAQKKRIHILLLDEALFDKADQEFLADKTLLLVRQARKTIKGVKSVIRYQSAEEIWKQVQKEATRKERSIRRIRQKPEGELIAVYSPVHRIGKTQFAIRLGKELAEKEPVLYLNLEEYSGMGHYFPEGQEKNLGDLFYYLRQERGNLGMKVSMIAGQQNNLDYIMPIPYVQDLKAVRQEEWLLLFERILKECIYGKIILDLGDSIDGLYTILKKCTNIYMPYIDELAAAAKMKQYVDNIRKLGMEEILEKTVQLRMDVDKEETE
ncbi:MAG: hypothetical protein U0L05_06915 [Schaedlerella sp.]|nr:hypothetical protein [Schaedlerella sp.]